MRLDEAVRTAVHDLADEARPVNLAAAALRRSRRMRNRRRAAIGAAVAAVLVAVPVAAIRANPAAAPTHRPAAPPSTGPSVVASPVPPDTIAGPHVFADGWMLGSVPAADQDGVWVYDRTARLFRLLKYRFAQPAPTGTLVAVWNEGRAGIHDLATGAVQWIDKPAASILPTQAWSPDGTRFFYTPDDPGDATGAQIIVVDAKTGMARPVGSPVRCGDGCYPTWLPGDRVGIDVGGLPPKGVQSFSAKDGHNTGLVPFNGWVGQGSPWSPDGKHVVILFNDGSQSGPRPRAVVEVATGTIVGSVKDSGTVYWTGPDHMLVVTSGGVAQVGLDGNRLGFHPQPGQFPTGEWAEATLIRE